MQFYFKLASRLSYEYFNQDKSTVKSIVSFINGSATHSNFFLRGAGAVKSSVVKKATIQNLETTADFHNDPIFPRDVLYNISQIFLNGGFCTSKASTFVHHWTVYLTDATVE